VITYLVEVEGLIVGRVQGENEDDALRRARDCYARERDGTLSKKFLVKPLHPVVDKVEKKMAYETQKQQGKKGKSGNVRSETK
jgi:hypothetical protein|tara:strand:- start:18 stop:266 length:249 start_codon:yes stop_codon:yes gene_type:complete